ncbi:MAG: molybdopterin molybdenumtransferase MoeA, partial [Candidatus Rokuibacteriota bacterium]
MLTVEQALEQILARAQRVETERVDVRAARGRVLAEPVVSPREIPPWPNSSMDGYAVRAADTAGAPVSLVVV